MERTNDLFWSLLKPEHLRARAFCRKLAGSRENGDDLYQDSLLVALSGFAGLRRIGSFRPWLYRIVVNTFRNRIRRDRRAPIIELTDRTVSVAPGHAPDRAYAARHRLEQALRVLSSRERALITLFELEGWPVRELAPLLETTESNIKVRLHRIRKKMRRALLRADRDNSETGEDRRQIEDDICVATKPGKD